MSTVRIHGLVIPTRMTLWIRALADTAYRRAVKAKQREERQKERTRGTRNRQSSGGAKCGAAKRAGGHCQLAAGFGTDHSGIGKCRFHGGNTPNHRLNAARQEAIFMGAPKEINPVDALTWCIHITAGEIEWFGERMAELEQEDWYEQSVLGKQLNILARERANATMRLAKFSKDAIALGIAERRVRIAEQYGAALARLLRGVLDDLDLTPAQKERAPAIVRKHLILLEGQSPQVALEKAA